VVARPGPSASRRAAGARVALSRPDRANPPAEPATGGASAAGRAPRAGRSRAGAGAAPGLTRARRPSRRPTGWRSVRAGHDSPSTGEPEIDREPRVRRPLRGSAAPPGGADSRAWFRSEERVAEPSATSGVEACGERSVAPRPRIVDKGLPACGCVPSARYSQRKVRIASPAVAMPQAPSRTSGPIGSAPDPSATRNASARALAGSRPATAAIGAGR